MTTYVRGIGQIARYRAERKPSGHRLTEFEAVDAYGPEILAEIDEFGAAVLLQKPGAAGEALRRRREELGFNQRQLANLAKLSPKTVADAEDDPEQVGIRPLERLAFLLGLDERRLATDESAGADALLGVRLRRLSEPSSEPTSALSKPAVLLLAESASVIATAERLRGWLRESTPWKNFQRSADYGDPTTPAYKLGYELAATARKVLNLGDGPIESMRELVEEQLGLTVIQGEMGPTVAGATIANGAARGIVLNVEGENGQPWVRRATLAHELGHLLFDPDEKLNRVTVDAYESMLANPEQSGGDFVEQRANAFAIAFLAPPESIRARFDSLHPTFTEADVVSVAQDFGIGSTAARYHLQNAFYRTTDAPPVRAGFDAEKWEIAENFTLDYFMPEQTPPQRRGRFSALVTRAYDLGRISDDTAAFYLGTDASTFLDALPTLRSMWDLPNPTA
jgi:Zn-dependent peptidase ImmA (M78 family)/DNA-binding XRE family transcriptional regulator